MFRELKQLTTKDYQRLSWKFKAKETFREENFEITILFFYLDAFKKS